MNIWFPQLAAKYIKIAYGAEVCSKEHIESWPHSGRASSHAPQLHPLWVYVQCRHLRVLRIRRSRSLTELSIMSDRKLNLPTPSRVPRTREDLNKTNDALASPDKLYNRIARSKASPTGP